jgi:choline monooxygenase
MGIVFINIDGHAPPLAEYLQPTRERVAAFDLTLLRESDLSYEHYFEGNWKLALEGGVEDYHIPWVHRQLGPSGDFRGESSGDRWVAVTCRRTMNVARGRFLDPNAGRPLPMFPHLPESGLAEASIILATLPATWIAAVTDHVVMTLYIPETPTRTRVRRRFHFIGDAATDEAHATTRKRVFDSWVLITQQDAPLVAETQKLLQQRDDMGIRPRFSPYWETAVHKFQRIIAAKLTGAELE